MSDFYNQMNLFQNNQDLGLLLPYLMSLAIVVIAIVGVWAAYTLYQQKQAEKLAWKRFYVLARRYTLNNREVIYLRRILNQHNVKTPSRILLEEDRFEKIFGPIESKGRKYDRHYIHSIRDKLFRHSPADSEGIRSTRQLMPGTPLRLQSQEGGQAVEAVLADVDNAGLVVVIQAWHRSAAQALRPGAQMQVEADNKSNTLQFKSQVKSVIPGPRKMLVLAHSSSVFDDEAHQRQLKQNVNDTLNKMASSKNGRSSENARLMKAGLHNSQISL